MSNEIPVCGVKCFGKFEIGNDAADPFERLAAKVFPDRRHLYACYFGNGWRDFTEVGGESLGGTGVAGCWIFDNSGRVAFLEFENL